MDFPAAAMVEGDDGSYAIVQTEDNGYVLAGFTTTYDRDYDCLLIKTNSTGDVEWGTGHLYHGE